MRCQSCHWPSQSCVYVSLCVILVGEVCLFGLSVAVAAAAAAVELVQRPIRTPCGRCLKMKCTAVQAQLLLCLSARGRESAENATILLQSWLDQTDKQARKEATVCGTPCVCGHCTVVSVRRRRLEFLCAPICSSPPLGLSKSATTTTAAIRLTCANSVHKIPLTFAPNLTLTHIAGGCSCTAAAAAAASRQPALLTCTETHTLCQIRSTLGQYDDEDDDDHTFRAGLTHFISR